MSEGQPAPLTIRAVAEQILSDQWKLGRWKNAEGEQQTTRIAWLPIYLLSDLDEETGAWPQTLLVVDWPEGKPDPYHCYVAHLHTQPNKARRLRLSRSRFHIEQYFQRDKDDLGLDHFEGRSWLGFDHHLVLAATAYIFVLLTHLESKKNSGYAWEGVLRAIQPWFVRLIGCCPRCHTKFDRIVFDPT